MSEADHDLLRHIAHVQHLQGVLIEAIVQAVTIDNPAVADALAKMKASAPVLPVVAQPPKV